MKRLVRSQSRQGVALIIVMIFLVLLSILIIGFFISVESEVYASKAFESDIAVKQLVSSATNIVTGQIVDGTRSTKTRRPPGTAGTIPAGERLAWASQPGMIRTWDDAGNGWKIFKLYSARDMVVGFDKNSRYSVTDKLATEIPNTWPGQPALYTDLNEPVLVEDPNGKIQRGGKKLRASYPIVDPLALAVDKVEGFLIAAPPGYGGPLSGGMPTIDATTDPTEFAGEDFTSNPAPMPTAWIYVLRDGTLTVPNSTLDDGVTATWTRLPTEVTPTKANPIVGRVAFWTDDESCKLNINTASEPTPWDTPRALTIQDFRYAKYQPGQREYQRFPGHPAMTALSPVLLPGTDLTAELKEEIYRLIPRVGTGGSQAGTLSLADAPNPMVLDKDRLFANPDELLFEPRLDPAHSTQRLAVPNDSSDLPNLKPLLTPERLRRTGFFLTATSRSPETNLFGQPRISLWPENADVTKRTPFDRVAAFCSTLQSSTANAVNPFYFQRRDPTSSAQDYDGITRNRELYAYLQNLTSAAVPGFGGRFSQKWGDDRDQILTEIFDYIRCTNLHDPQLGATPYAPTGQVTPIVINDTKGFGRFHTISQFGMHFICTGRTKAPVPPSTSLTWEGLGPAPAPLIANDRRIQVAFVFEPFSPSVGWPALQEDLSFDVTFSPSTSPAPGSAPLFSLNATPLNFPNIGQSFQLKNVIGTGDYGLGKNQGGAGGLRGTIRGLGKVPGSSAPPDYPWVSDAVIVNVPPATATNPAKMVFAGGQITVKIYAGTGGTPVQTFTVDFPGGDFPVPDLSPSLPTDPTQTFWWSFKERYAQLENTPYLPGPEYAGLNRRWPGANTGFNKGGIYRAEDVVRSVVPEHGDIRLIAALSNVPAITQGRPMWFPATDDWNVKPPPELPHPFVHLFSEPAGTQFSYGFANEPSSTPQQIGTGVFSSAVDAQLTPAHYHYSKLPEIRPGAGKQFNLLGDFDNGVAQTVDGAYINLPDEGNLSGLGGVSYWSPTASTAAASTFSPNRLMPSAGMLGSLPTGVKRMLANPTDPHAWETLLFRPQPNHPGMENPPDHLLMDLFWMPVIEPYAISEPFSTAGKVNLNYEIAPFNYIHRATALVGALKGEQPLAIPTGALPGSPDGAAKIYKLWDAEVGAGILPNDPANKDPQVGTDWEAAYTGRPPFNRLRKPIDPVKTLLPFEQKFAQGQIFRSATQICEMHLVRQGNLEDDATPELNPMYDSGAFWDSHVVTGDNTRERPYANLYSRLTTRSNSFTVHIRAQVLRQIGSKNAAGWASWREDKDQRQAEYRGSVTLERYIDPADPTLADFARDKNAVVDNAYRTRVISTKKFTP